jgi:hypothetical protein
MEDFLYSGRMTFLNLALEIADRNRKGRDSNSLKLRGYYYQICESADPLNPLIIERDFLGGRGALNGLTNINTQ